MVYLKRNEKEKKRKRIELSTVCILYVIHVIRLQCNRYYIEYNNITSDRSAVDGETGPKLWCGMASGKLQVFDASTWVLEQPVLQAKNRIVSTTL